MTSAAGINDNYVMKPINSRHAHKRSSSQWVPPSGPLYNPIEIFKSRQTRVKGSRMIQPNHVQDAARYNLPNYRQFTNNSITTTKYSLISFVPLNIYHQLRNKFANLYFFMIAALNFVPAVAAYNKWLALIPPTFVIGVTMLKDGYEDIRRWRFDKQVNSKTCRVWDKDKKMFRKVEWKYILVGDFVHVSNDQDIPADVLFLRSSDTSGVCYVETSNLDGETSLKQRNVPHRYINFSEEDSDFTPPKFTGTIFCEKPDKGIYTVTAKIESDPGVIDIITKENMLLRGSKLKNTTFIEGIVMYAGHDTKVMLNNGRAPYKLSGIEHLTNRFIVICVLILVFMVLLGAIMSGVFVGGHDKTKCFMDNSTESCTKVPYIPWNIPSPVVEGVISVGSFIICYQVLVPISLYITVEIIKLFQIYFISLDIDLYDEELDYRVNCRSLNIPEELGQVTHVLSDKTGTLTENKMIFRNCAFDDIDNGGEFDPDKLDKDKPVISLSLQNRIDRDWQTNSRMRHFFMNILLNNSVVVNKKPHTDLMEIGTYEAGVYTIGNACFYDMTPDDFQKIVDEAKNPTQSDTLAPAAVAASLSDIPEEDEMSVFSQQPRPFSIISDGSSTVVSRVSSFSSLVASVVKKRIISPISTILPGGANDFIPRRPTVIQADFCPYEAESPDELALIQGIEMYGFELEDRCGTQVMIRCPDGSARSVPILMTLPFDSHRKRMSVVVEGPTSPLLYTKGADSAIMERLHPDCKDLASTLSPMIYEYSCRGLRTLCFAMKKITNEEFEEFRQSWDFVRQDTSPDREMMMSNKADEMENNLRLLGVTGIEDRLQDGVHQTIESLREAGIQVWVLTGDKLETAENIARASGLFEESKAIFRIETPDDFKKICNESHNLILSPVALKLVREGDAEMIEALKKADCVLCYRMTPSEKADIVHAVKKFLKGNVLAIGDGANDVPMIQAAHVGIGVKGKEGMQAVMACDYAISRFRFLRKLLLVHGHWCYDRLALSFLYFLYKNTNCVFILFFYQFYDGYSGAFSIDPTYSVLYPIIFTSVQPIVVGVMDQDHSASTLLKNPHYYSSGRLGELYTYKLFFLNVLDGIYQAAVIYYFAYFTIYNSVAGLWNFGFYMATGMMLVNCGHLAIEVRCWTSWLISVFGFFFALHFGYFALFCYFVGPAVINDPPTMVFVQSVQSANFWMCMLITVVAALLPRVVLRVASRSRLW